MHRSQEKLTMLSPFAWIDPIAVLRMFYQMRNDMPKPICMVMKEFSFQFYTLETIFEKNVKKVQRLGYKMRIQRQTGKSQSA